jgi:Rrf2 family protein
MKLITRDTDYAVRALVFITRQKAKVISVSELVRELKIPRPFLRKILQQLNKKKILHSSRGSGGGFSLSVAAGKIFLVDLIRIFQGPLEINECLFKKQICPNTEICLLREKICRIEQRVLSDLKAITIASLLKGRRH